MKNDEDGGLTHGELARAGEHTGRGPIKKRYVKPDLMEFGTVTALTHGGLGSYGDAGGMMRVDIPK